MSETTAMLILRLQQRMVDNAVPNGLFTINANDLEAVLDRLQHSESEKHNALAMIRIRGVPESRARYLSHALDVLLTRLDREIRTSHYVIDRIQSQCIARTADMPGWAFQWRKADDGTTLYVGWDRPRKRDEGRDYPWLQTVPAPDHCPEEPGPVYRHIVDVE